VGGIAAVPTVYLTLGTSFNVRSRDLFARAIAGFRDLTINLIVTVGRTLDPADFDPQPPHVRIERYIPQSLLLPHCDLVVLHGGSGSVMGALAHGLPLVVIPLGADMPLNAGRCAALGVGRVIDVADATPETVRTTVEAVLADRTYRTNAERIRDEIAALPGPEHALQLLERLAAGKRPLRTT
jgi:MGT family glycosyltransferase